MNLKEIKLNSTEIQANTQKERFEEILGTFFKDEDKESHFTHLTYLLWEYDIIEENEAEQLEKFLTNIGDNIKDSVLTFQTKQLNKLNK